MRAYFFCVIFTQLFGNSNYYPYFCIKIIVDRVAFLFGTSDGYFRFTNLCETNKIDIKEIEW